MGEAVEGSIPPAKVVPCKEVFDPLAAGSRRLLPAAVADVEGGTVGKYPL